MKNQSVGVAGDRPRALAVGIGRSRLLLAIGVGLCCAAGLLLTVGAKLNQAATIDPYVYAGYINDYPGLLERFGPTYYSDRIAFIYPERVFSHFFGLKGGYFAFRLVALASAVAAVFSIGVRVYGYAPAILAAVWLSFTPWLPRALLWTYPDGIAVVYLLVGVAFLLVPLRRRLTYHVAAGAAFALAVDCNLFLLAVCGLLGPGWAFVYRREGIVWLARALFALAAGFFATFLALALILYVQFPAHGFFFQFATIREAMVELRGEGHAGYKPLSSIIWNDHHFILLIPVTFVLATFAVVLRRWTIVRTPNGCIDFAVLAASYLASIVCLWLIFHFGFHDALISLPYYTSYLMPGCVLALIVLGGEAERLGGRIFGAAAVHSGTGLILLSWLALPVLPNPEIASSFYFWLAVAAVNVAAAAALGRTAAASVVLLAGVVLLSMSQYQRGFYQIRTTSGEADATEWDVYRGAIALRQFVNADVGPDESIGFWYRNEQDSDPRLDSIQSTYLYQYTRLVRSDDSPGMPLVDEDFRRTLPARRFLVLLGLSDPETNAGLAALAAANLPFREIKRSHFQGQFWEYTAALIEMKPRAIMGPLLFNIPLTRLELDPMAVNDGSISPLADGLHSITAASQWTNSLRARFRPEDNAPHGAVVVRVRLHVEEGRVGIEISAVGNPGNLIRKAVIYNAPEAQDVYLDLPDASAAEYLFITNESADGRSRLVVNSVDVFKPR